MQTESHGPSRHPIQHVVAESNGRILYLHVLQPIVGIHHPDSWDDLIRMRKEICVLHLSQTKLPQTMSGNSIAEPARRFAAGTRPTSCRYDTPVHNSRHQCLTLAPSQCQEGASFLPNDPLES